MYNDTLTTIREIKKTINCKPFHTQLTGLYKERGVCDTVAVYLELARPQSYGPKMENLFISEKQFSRVSSQDDRGDFVTKVGKYGEYKFTYSPEEKKFSYNFVQIRPWQKLDGYVFEVYSDLCGFVRFCIPKDKMTILLERYGNLAHGTKKTNKNSKKEYALRGNIGDKLWKDMVSFDQPNLFS